MDLYGVRGEEVRCAVCDRLITGTGQMAGSCQCDKPDPTIPASKALALAESWRQRMPPTLAWDMGLRIAAYELEVLVRECGGGVG